MGSSESYHQPTALIVISSVSIGLGAIAAAWILLDIIWRRGWRSMMYIMIPVYVINALYLWPITLWVYIKYGRPPPPQKHGVTGTQEAHQPPTANASGTAGEETQRDMGRRGHNDTSPNEEGEVDKTDMESGITGEQGGNEDNRSAEDQDNKKESAGNREQGGHSEHHHKNSGRPMFATVTVGVCHCGAGCVLGDIVGEWLVYGTNAAFGSPRRLLWAEMLVDFGFAFAFGIIFQYFSIAPMAGQYGPKIIYRALKADALSLLFFEVGLFGWMAIFQVAIFNWELEMPTVTYWWMMQIGMFLGHWTGVPINWWLIKTRVKMPCA
ncbi:hypothetical protein LTR96_010938 [Exophiala xenobiotica]|nr:hypothetical protein LTR40_002637 [Exophiala xenobiotica]KAK5263675.1 hypothetical protein LTR96_010938 [Exophiala xenobiotica]KAK5358382.1 hypothetical protein LTS13_010933 [Exophiala xenobiotica]KAK5394050.1 hypothetical protein LTR79_008263 [Exophiala xenobiotica]KAK5405145.1 hypothetical protein LTR90_011068 [Exophiala xenobiotica]